MKTRMATATLGLGTLVFLPSTGRAQDDWQKADRVGDRVEFGISGSHWQPRVVIEKHSGVTDARPARGL